MRKGPSTSGTLYLLYVAYYKCTVGVSVLCNLQLVIITTTFVESKLDINCHDKNCSNIATTWLNIVPFLIAGHIS